MKSLTEEKQLQVKLLEEWIDEQPLFPKNIEEILVVRFLHSNYYDMDKAKTTAELFFNIRASLSEILTNRDLMEPSVQDCLRYVNLASYHTSKKRSILIWQLNDPGLQHYDYITNTKVFFLSSDASFMEDENLAEEDIFILDVKDVTIKLLWLIKLALAKKTVKYLEGAMPKRLKGIHMVNSPPIIDKVVGIFKPFMRKDLQEIVHFHRPNSTTIFDHFSKDELPVDYGGTRPPMEELMKDMVGVLQRNRKRLSQEMLWSSLKTEKNNTKPAPARDIVPFRTLAID